MYWAWHSPTPVHLFFFYSYQLSSVQGFQMDLNLQEMWCKKKKMAKILECQENWLDIFIRLGYPEWCHKHFIFNCVWLHFFEVVLFSKNWLRPSFSEKIMIVFHVLEVTPSSIIKYYIIVILVLFGWIILYEVLFHLKKNKVVFN